MAITETEKKKGAAVAVNQRSGDSPAGEDGQTVAMQEADDLDSGRNGPYLTERDHRSAPSLNLYCSLRTPQVDDTN